MVSGVGYFGTKLYQNSGPFKYIYQSYLHPISKHSLNWHIRPILEHSMLIRPSQHSIIIFTLMFRAPPRISVRFPLQTSIRGAHDRLSNVVKAVSRVMGEFLCYLAFNCGLVCLYEVRLSSCQCITSRCGLGMVLTRQWSWWKTDIM